MKFKTTCISFYTFFIVGFAIAQDMDFTQWQANLNALNPAFTGISNNPKLHFSYRSRFNGFQGPGESALANTAFATYDQRISPRGGCIGINYLDDVIGNARLRTKSVNVQYARIYKLKTIVRITDTIKRNDLKLRIGISVGGHKRSVLGAYLKNQDLENPRTGIKYASVPQFPSQTLYTNIIYNFGIGAALNYKNIYGGFGINNLIEPMDAFAGNPTTRTPRRYTANIGGFFPLNKENSKTAIISPYIIYQRQNIFTEILPGININKGVFTAGISYRHTEPRYKSLNILAGISKGRFKAAYNHDFGINSDLIHLHEISLSFYFGKLKHTTEKEIEYYFRKMGF